MNSEWKCLLNSSVAQVLIIILGAQVNGGTQNHIGPESCQLSLGPHMVGIHVIGKKIHEKKKIIPRGRRGESPDGWGRSGLEPG